MLYCCSKADLLWMFMVFRVLMARASHGKRWMDGGTGIQVAVLVRFTFHLNGVTVAPMHSMIPT